METEIRIQVPEGMEIDRENSTFDYIRFKPKLSYQEISKKFQPYNSSVFTNKYYLSKLLTFRKLLEVADYLNDNWKPNWNDVNQLKYYISYNYEKNIFEIDYSRYINSELIYFSSRENAEKAIEIIGKEELKYALF